MTATLTFHLLGDADRTRIDLADGKNVLIDYADVHNPDDFTDKQIDLASKLKTDPFFELGVAPGIKGKNDELHVEGRTP